MDRSDVAEAIVAAALEMAGFNVISWDKPVAGFFVDPDLIAERGQRKIVVLVNASDSFFASQKKIWRNIEGNRPANPSSSPLVLMCRSS